MSVVPVRAGVIAVVTGLLLPACRTKPHADRGVPGDDITRDAVPEAAVVSSSAPTASGSARSAALDAEAEAEPAEASLPCGPLPRDLNAGLAPARRPDIDGDGTADAIVTVGADAEYTEEVYLKRGGCWTRVARLRGLVERAPTVTGGMHDLVTGSACRTICCNVTRRLYKWKGAAYVVAKTWTEKQSCLDP